MEAFMEAFFLGGGKESHLAGTTNFKMWDGIAHPDGSKKKAVILSEDNMSPKSEDPVLP